MHATTVVRDEHVRHGSHRALGAHHVSGILIDVVDWGIIVQ
jgi:hypothetical protein